MQVQYEITIKTPRGSYKKTAHRLKDNEQPRNGPYNIWDLNT